MSFVANYKKHKETWEYICNEHNGTSLLVARWQYLLDLSFKYGRDKLKVAFQDPDTGKWTKWKAFPGTTDMLFHPGRNYCLLPAIDVHRSVFDNEIVVESDYSTYEENYEASRLIGEIIERKGFKPLYYFSGNKSIHIHVFIDWRFLESLDVGQKKDIKKAYGGSVDRLKRDFIKWLRAKMITCWDTEAREFDKNLIRASHLIRCELSKNKKGYKTFLGYTYKDLSFVPIICNEANQIYPKLGKIVMGSPVSMEWLIDEFLVQRSARESLRKSVGSTKKLSTFLENKELRDCVKIIMSDEFKATGDGKKRGMFILINELKRVFGKAVARTMVYDWNNKMGEPIQFSDIELRLERNEDYTLPCNYIHEFLESVGIEASKKCKCKLYKLA